jgi:GNAT superfamily N-acetyltransferase
VLRPDGGKVTPKRDKSPYLTGAGPCHRGFVTLIDVRSIPTSEDALSTSSGFRVRPIASTDAAALVRFHAHLSPRSVRLRYFSPHPELQPDEVTHLTQVDGVNRAAYVVERDCEIVAVGRYDRLDDPCSAEVAFVVADEFQHHGLGTMLLKQLGGRARRVGIGEFKASVLVENSAMLAVFHGSGFPMTQTRTYDVVELVMEIGPRWL